MFRLKRWLSRSYRPAIAANIDRTRAPDLSTALRGGCLLDLIHGCHCDSPFCLGCSLLSLYSSPVGTSKEVRRSRRGRS